MKTKCGLTQEQLKRKLSYNPESGEFTWRTRGGSPTFNSSYAGKIAGHRKSPDKQRGTFYIVIKINSVLYYAHRLAWLYVYGEWPKEQIDHINLDGTDNRIENLRLASASENRRNIKKRAVDCTSQYKNVYCKTRGKKPWFVKFVHEGKRYQSRYFQTEIEAAELAELVREELHGEFARHY